MNIAEQIQQNIVELPQDKQAEVLDFVLFLRQKRASGAEEEDRERKKRIMKEALENLASMKTFADIEDPVEWQREIRQDRALPGRPS